MTIDERITLARRAVACKGWRWMSGMRYRLHPTHPWFRYDGEDCSDDDGNPIPQAPPNLQSHNAIPDLTDPATLGCLLALVREAWRCPTVYVRQGTTRRVSDGVIAWEVCDLWLDAEACRALGVDRQGSVGSWGHGSEAEALVAALEAAP